MKIVFKYLLSVSVFYAVYSCTEQKNELKEHCTELGVFPQINIVIEDSTITKSKYSIGSLTSINTAECSTTELEINIKGRGNTSWSFPKQSYQIKLSRPSPLLNLPASKKFILIANYSDKSMLRNELAFSLSRMSKLDWTPTSQFFELTINQQYLGVYQLVQKIEISDNSLNTDVLVEIDHKERLHNDDVFFETKNHLYCFKDFANDSNHHSFGAKNYITKAETSILTGENYKQYYDATALADWYIINEIAKNNDALFNSSVYFHFKYEQQIQMGPVWDYDISFGNINYNGNDSTDGFFIKNATFFKQLFKNDNFIVLVKKRFQYFYSQKKSILQEIDNNAKMIKDAAKRNFAKWPILGKYVWPNNYVGNSYQEEVDYLKFWLNARMDWLNEAYSLM
ncbi:MAG: CotH kinase family protein [Crocinitomicaceae bacterium]